MSNNLIGILTIIGIALAGFMGFPTIASAADHAESPALTTVRLPATSVAPGGELRLIVENRGEKGFGFIERTERDNGPLICNTVELVVLVTPYIVNGDSDGAVLKDIVTPSVNDISIPAGKALFFPIVNVEAVSIAVQFRPEALDACDVSLSLQGFDADGSPTPIAQGFNARVPVQNHGVENPN